MGNDILRNGRVKNWFYLENGLLDREDLTIYEKMIYIVIARFVDKEDKAFPSVPTIAKKGSMSERQVQIIINSLVKKGLIKKESRINKDNKSKTSNLYTLQSVKRNQSGNDKENGVVHVIHHHGEHGAPPLVNDIHPNNTIIKNTSLNNVNGASREVVENPRGKNKEESTVDKEDINDIKRKIKESLKKGEKYSLMESIKRVVNKFPDSKRYRLKENELLAEEIAEILEDDHSLGAFRTVVEKIPDQQIRIFLSIIKDTYLTGRIKKSRGAMFITLAKDYARENNINLNFK
jgi:hypothetical protein